MIWTYERLEALRVAAISGMTVPQAAEALSLGAEQIRYAAKRYKIGLAPAVRVLPPKRPPRQPPDPGQEAALRARWEKLLPELKASLVRQLERNA